MKVYLEPTTNSRGIMRVRNALVKYAPSWVEVVDNASHADFEIIHVYGRIKTTTDRVNGLRYLKKPYAMIQYALKSTMRPSSLDWLFMWQGAKVVWSYYDLKQQLVDDSGSSGMLNNMLNNKFNFYYAPLGVESSIFDAKSLFKGKKAFVVLASSQHALSEGARECAFATKRVGGRMFFLGHELRRGPDIVCKSDLTDQELVGYYTNSRFVCGLRRCEGFELPVIEGAMCGARPIVFDRPEMREWFGDFAIFIPELGRNETIDHLESIFRSSIPEITKEEKDIIIKRFDWHTIINGFWEKLL